MIIMYLWLLFVLAFFATFIIAHWMPAPPKVREILNIVIWIAFVLETVRQLLASGIELLDLRLSGSHRNHLVVVVSRVAHLVLESSGPPIP